MSCCCHRTGRSDPGIDISADISARRRACNKTLHHRIRIAGRIGYTHEWDTVPRKVSCLQFCSSVDTDVFHCHVLLSRIDCLFRTVVGGDSSIKGDTKYTLNNQPTWAILPSNQMQYPILPSLQPALSSIVNKSTSAIPPLLALPKPQAISLTPSNLSLKASETRGRVQLELIE